MLLLVLTPLWGKSILLPLCFFLGLSFKLIVNSQSLMASIFICVACALIHTCRRSGQHLVTLERDVVIFNGMLAPLRDPTPSLVIDGLQFLNIVTKDDKEHVGKVLKKS